MAIPFGKDAVLYYSATALSDSNDAGTTSWTEYDNVRDVTGNYTAETVDVTTRATAKLGWGATASVLNNGEISFNMPQTAIGTSDTVFDAIRDAWLNKTEVALMALNGDESTVGAQGLAANFSVSMSQNQPIKDVQSWDVTCTVSSYPEWYEVS